VGESMVGKTYVFARSELLIILSSSLFVRVTKNVFGTQYRPTIGMDFNIKKYKILDIPFSMILWDTGK